MIANDFKNDKEFIKDILQNNPHAAVLKKEDVMDLNSKELECGKVFCFANFEGHCICLKEAYPEEIKCPFYKESRKKRKADNEKHI